MRSSGDRLETSGKLKNLVGIPQLYSLKIRSSKFPNSIKLVDRSISWLGSRDMFNQVRIFYVVHTVTIRVHYMHEYPLFIGVHILVPSWLV